MGKTVQREEAWLGLIQHDIHEVSEKVVLDYAWVKQNIQAPLRTLIKEM
jgi:hypothetical protein